MVPKSDCFAGDADVDTAGVLVVPSVVEAAAAAPSTTATTAGAAGAPSGDAGTVGGGVALSALLLSVSAAVTTGFVGADPFANDGLNAVTCCVTIDADRQHSITAKNRQVQFGIIRVDAMIVFFVEVIKEFLILIVFLL